MRRRGTKPRMRNKTNRMPSAPAVSASLCAAALLVGCAASSARAAEPLQMDSDPILVQAFSTRCDIASKMSPDGAIGENRKYEQGAGGEWYIEEQKDAYIGAWGAAVNHSPPLAREAETAFDWGFQRESGDGSFPMPKSVPLGRRIHSAAMFVEAAAHSMLDLAQSGVDPGYGRSRADKLVRAAVWLARSIPCSPNADPALVETATTYDQGHGHRPYEKAAALQEASLFALGRDRALLQQAADASIRFALSGDDPVGERRGGAYSAGGETVLLRGVNPESDNVNDPRRPLSVSYDSSYEATGLFYAALYAATTPNAGLRGQVLSMLRDGENWESSRFRPSGEADLSGNTRVSDDARDERNPSGEAKKFAYQTALFGFCYDDALTGANTFQGTAENIVRYKKWNR